MVTNCLSKNTAGSRKTVFHRITGLAVSLFERLFSSRSFDFFAKPSPSLEFLQGEGILEEILEVINFAFIELLKEERVFFILKICAFRSGQQNKMLR